MRKKTKKSICDGGKGERGRKGGGSYIMVGRSREVAKVLFV